MTYFPRLMRDWHNPYWKPKFFGGRRLPRKLKKKFKAYGFYWLDPEAFLDRWVRTKPKKRSAR